MKLVLIMYNEAIDEEVMEALENSGQKAFTKWTKTLGFGDRSGPHLMSHVWPKANNVLACAAEDSTAQAILDNVKNLRVSLGHEGVKAFLLPVEAAT